MEPKAHHLIIGLFTTVAAVAILTFALWLGKSTSDRDWAYYDIAFDWAVSGLAKGNPVLYTGVEIGNVVELRLAPDNPSQVRVLVRVDETIPIREDSRARLILANITGSMSIQFTGGSPDSPLLEGKKDDPPVIKASPSMFDSLVNNGESLINKADAVLDNAAALLAGDNADNLAAILENIRGTTELLSSNHEQVEIMLQRVGEAAGSIARTSDTATELLSNEGREAFSSIQESLAHINSVTSRIDDITDANAGALSSGLEGMGDLAPALRELRHTLRNFNRFTRRLEDDPAGTIWGSDNMKELSQ